jgi:hypothetical protein
LQHCGTLIMKDMGIPSTACLGELRRKWRTIFLCMWSVLDTFNSCYIIRNESPTRIVLLNNVWWIMNAKETFGRNPSRSNMRCNLGVCWESLKMPISVEIVELQSEISTEELSKTNMSGIRPNRTLSV